MGNFHVQDCDYRNDYSADLLEKMRRKKCEVCKILGFIENSLGIQRITKKHTFVSTVGLFELTLQLVMLTSQLDAANQARVVPVEFDQLEQLKKIIRFCTVCILLSLKYSCYRILPYLFCTAQQIQYIQKSMYRTYIHTGSYVLEPSTHRRLTRSIFSSK